MYYEVKVSYTGQDKKTGKTAKISEVYLVSAVSFTDAESKTTAYIAEIANDFLIKVVRTINTQVVGIEDENAEIFKISGIGEFQGDDSPKPKMVVINFLVHANSFEHAKKQVEDYWYSGIEILSITKSKIVFVIE